MSEPLRASGDALDDPAELAERVRADGYLYLPRLLEPRRVTELRRRLVAIARAAGWVRPDGGRDDGEAVPEAFCVDPEPRYRRVYRTMYRLEAAHALAHDPALLSLLGKLVRPPVLVHPRPALRVVFPGAAFASPAHQDFPVVQGTRETYTTWIPLMDCPVEQGVLEVAPGSHLDGVRAVMPSLGVGGAEVAETPRRWARGDLRAGDVLLFHSLTVHRSTPNTTKRLRLSLDCRYQSAHEPVNAVSLDVSGSGQTWDEIYAGWRSRRHQYYWREFDLQLSAFDPSYLAERDRRAFEMGERADPRCVSALQRIAARDPDAATRARASRLLERLARPAALNDRAPISHERAQPRL